MLLVSIAVYSACPTAARAAIVCSDTSSRAGVWRRIYDRLPAPWKASGEVIVREVSDDEMDDVVEREEGRWGRRSGRQSLADGYFMKAKPGHPKPEIILREVLSRDESEYVFTHEYGHLVWYSKLSSELRSEYSEVWRRVLRRGRLVTRYAEDDPAEGFAEAFAYFHLNGRELQDADPASYRFLLRVEDFLYQPAKSKAKLSSKKPAPSRLKTQMRQAASQPPASMKYR